MTADITFVNMNMLFVRYSDACDKELHLPLRVVPRVFEPQDYAIALRQGSALREPVNQVLLDKTASADWQDLLYRYLGE